MDFIVRFQEGYKGTQRNEREMTKAEKSLVIFLETCLVDGYGKVKSGHMNDDDFEIIERWKKTGFVEFERLPADEVFGNERRDLTTHRVKFSAKAWKEAHKERKAKSERI